MTDSKNTELHESLSALMDGEVNAADTRFSLRQLQADDDGIAMWDRYHRMGAALRDEPLAAPALSASVMAAIATIEQDAPAAVVPVKAQKARGAWGWWPAAIGVATTAAIAMVVTTSLMPLDENMTPTRSSQVAVAPPVNNPTIHTATLSPSNQPVRWPSHAASSLVTPVALTDAAAGTGDTPVAAEWHLAPPEVQRRLNGYLINHAEYASRGAGRDMMQYVRLVGQGNAGE